MAIKISEIPTTLSSITNETLVEVSEKVGETYTTKKYNLKQISDSIEDQIVDGVTDKSPSQNAVYDALAGKADTTYVNSELATKIGSVSEDTTPELGGELDAGEHTIGFTERSNTSSAGAVTIDWTKSNHQSITLTEDTTFTFTAPSNPCNLTLRIIQDATGGRNVTFPTFKTPSGVNLSFTTTAGAEDLLMLYFDGTNYIAGILADVQ